MAQLQQGALKSEIKAQNQCRLCMNLASEFCSFTNFIEDTRTVQEVIKMLLSIEDDPGLPQQICSSCSRELLHMARLKDCWVANQFTLARQATLVVPDLEKESQWTDMVQFQMDDQTGEEIYLEVDENVSESELFLEKAELREFTAEEPVEAPAKEVKKYASKYVKKCAKYKLRCNKCCLSFPTLKLKTEHIKLHNKCEICGATFTMKIDLRRHMRKHNGELPYGCPHCYQRFSRMNHVREHVKKHENVQSFACLLCTKNFSYKKGLIQHKREAHSNTRRTQRQKATKEERLPIQRKDRTIRQSGGDKPPTGAIKEEQVEEDYELIID
uniref:Putative c2h2-type zn-finger protein n=1 Tax=Culex tarsalis TaxID=7177 RepID=A0A1Q3EZ85_CULTA